MDKSLERLPKWAQSRILNLEADNARMRAERDLALIRGGSFEESDTYLLDHVAGHTPLPAESSIRFLLPWEDWVQETFIDARIARSTRSDGEGPWRPYLEVRAGRGLRIVPMSSNSIRLYAQTPVDIDS